jgi:hypothetical protein
MLFCAPKCDDYNATLFFMCGQNNRADKPASIPKERGHGLAEETSQFVRFFRLRDELHDTRMQLYRHWRLYRLEVAERNFPYGTMWNHGIPRYLQVN